MRSLEPDLFVGDIKGMRGWGTALRAAMVVFMAGNSGWAQSTIRPQDRVKEAIAETDLVTLAGSVHPAVAQAVSSVAVDSNFPMEHMILLLQPDAAQQAALDQLVAEQQDARSSQYHKFLSPELFAAQFGASASDLTKITAWLGQHGLAVEEVAANHLSIIFSGTASGVASAFKTEVRQYTVNGAVHHANASEAQIPAALAGVVKGVVKLHDFQARSYAAGLRVVGQVGQALYNGAGGTHSLAPADFAVIYNVRGLYTSGLNGAGQSIAVVGRSDVKLSDVQSFRSQFGLPANNPTVIVAQGSGPGFTGDADATEATLDVEWAGAVAPQAAVKLVIARSTASADGVDLAAMYAVNHNVAPILSVSFGSCEADMAYSSASGSTELSFYNSLWEQAAAQGISVFVAAGDAGAAGCEAGSVARGTQRGVNGIGSSPYATTVGGTEFNEGSNAGLYWLAGSNPILGTAQSYIPEVVWNESGANSGTGLWASGGGPSSQWTKPSWQTANGVPADGHRDVPDVSLTAAAHDGYLIVLNGSLTIVSGTSAATPSLASLFTIVNQKYKNTQGNVNPVLYPLAIRQEQGGAAVFHDVTAGNNSVPGVTGYAAGIGYDAATGLGSVDGVQLVNHWTDVSANGTFSLSLGATALSVQAGQNTRATVTLSVSNGFSWPVTLSVSGAPSGVAANFDQAAFGAPGSGATTLEVGVSAATVSGSYTLIVTATGGGITQTASVVLTVAPIPTSCSLTLNPTSATLRPASATNVRLTCLTPQGKLGNLGLVVSGTPSGVITGVAPTTLVPGTGTSVLTITAGSTAAAGSYTLGITASGGTFSQTVHFSLSVAIPPNFSVTAASSTLAMNQGAGAATQIAVAHSGAFNNTVSLSLGSLPPGMTGTFQSTQFAAPGDGTTSLTLQAGLATPAGRYTIQVLGTGNAGAAAGVLQNAVTLAVTVNPAPSFSLSSSTVGVAVKVGQAAVSLNVTVGGLLGGFNSAVALSVTGVPANLTASFGAPSFAAPGSGTTTLTLTAASGTTPGVYRLTIAALGGGVTKDVNLMVTVIGPPGFTINPAVSSLGLVAGATFTSGITITPQNGFSAPVTVVVGTLPAGISATLSSGTISSPNSPITLTVQTTAAVPMGSYTIPLSATATGVALPVTASIALALGSIQTTLGAAGVTVTRGGSATATITVTATNFTGVVTFLATGLPVGVTAQVSPVAILGSGTATLTLSTSSSAGGGTYAISVRTSGGGTVSTMPLNLTIN